jgi:N-hydroxyarylamine O-acetyltransferase
VAPGKGLWRRSLRPRYVGQMAFEPDLALYFERIGVALPTGVPTRPGLELLNTIVSAHVRAIPFENLDVLLGRPIDLSPAAVEHKLLVSRRGGYCFEQNTLLMYVLRALGYSVTPIGARVRVSRPRNETPPRTHVFLRVELEDGPWLCDVGIGGLSLASALRLVTDVTQPTPHEPRRIVSQGEWRGLGLRAPDAVLYHQAYFDDAWHDVCEFTLEEMPEIDRQLANWYTSAHPGSHFKSRLLVALATPSGRKTLLDRRFTVRADGASQTRVLGTPAELVELLQHEFGLSLPAGVVPHSPGLDW